MHTCVCMRHLCVHNIMLETTILSLLTEIVEKLTDRNMKLEEKLNR